MFSCRLEDLLKPCRPNPANDFPVWTRLNEIPPGFTSSLATLQGHVLAIGVEIGACGRNSTREIHCYDAATNSWTVVGEIPTTRYYTLTAVLPSNELIVVGGERDGRNFHTNEIATI